jgi:hypothetical protein
MVDRAMSKDQELTNIQVQVAVVAEQGNPLAL